MTEPMFFAADLLVLILTHALCRLDYKRISTDQPTIEGKPGNWFFVPLHMSLPSVHRNPLLSLCNCDGDATSLWRSRAQAAGYPGEPGTNHWLLLKGVFSCYWSMNGVVLRRCLPRLDMEICKSFILYHSKLNEAKRNNSKYGRYVYRWWSLELLVPDVLNARTTKHWKIDQFRRHGRMYRVQRQRQLQLQ